VSEWMCAVAWGERMIQVGEWLSIVTRFRVRLCEDDGWTGERTLVRSSGEVERCSRRMALLSSRGESLVDVMRCVCDVDGILVEKGDER
jgi:hypothetical protein